MGSPREVQDVVSVGVDGVDGGSVVYQDPDQLALAAVRCEVQWRDTLRVLDTGVSGFLTESACDCEAYGVCRDGGASCCACVEHRVSLAVDDERGCACVEQGLGHV